MSSPGSAVPIEDQILVEECLKGSEEAWCALIYKYKNLIFSIPIKYGFSSTDATDIFQTVCLALLSEMPRLREPRALAAWLIQTTSHKCFRWRDRLMRDLNRARYGESATEHHPKGPEELLREVEREQILREALSELPLDCKRLVDLLFFPTDPFSYDDIARSLGIPKGSIGPTRMRCLHKLRQLLDKKGF